MYAAPPPRKVRQGKIEAEGLTVETMGGETVAVAWGDIRCVFMGRMEPRPGAGGTATGDAPAQRLGRMIASGIGGPVGKAAFNVVQKRKSDGGAAAAAMANSAYSVIDVYPEGHPSPVRFETSGTNMRTLLGPDAGYSGDLNILALVRRFSELAPQALHRSATEVVARGRHFIRVYPSREDLYLASRSALREMASTERPGSEGVEPARPVEERLDDSAAPPPVEDSGTATRPPPDPRDGEGLASKPTVFPSESPPSNLPPPPAMLPPAPPVEPSVPLSTPSPLQAPEVPGPSLRPSASPSPSPLERDMFGEAREAERRARHSQVLVFITLAAVGAAIAWAFFAH
jgi:hypothetical protein